LKVAVESGNWQLQDFFPTAVVRGVLLAGNTVPIWIAS